MSWVSIPMMARLDAIWLGSRNGFWSSAMAASSRAVRAGTSSRRASRCCRSCAMLVSQDQRPFGGTTSRDRLYGSSASRPIKRLIGTRGLVLRCAVAHPQGAPVPTFVLHRLTFGGSHAALQLQDRNSRPSRRFDDRVLSQNFYDHRRYGGRRRRLLRDGHTGPDVVIPCRTISGLSSTNPSGNALPFLPRVRCESDHSPPDARGCNLHQVTRRVPRCAAILPKPFWIPAILPRPLILTFHVSGRESGLQQPLSAARLRLWRLHKPLGLHGREVTPDARISAMPGVASSPGTQCRLCGRFHLGGLGNRGGSNGDHQSMRFRV